MNKIFNINLGGYAFTIDEDAYNALQDYLSSIRGHFANSEGCEEILYDIEVRMAELFKDGASPDQIVSNKILDQAIKTMGTPADFGVMEEEHTSSTKTQAQNIGTKQKVVTGRRLFRDPDDKVIGGVCAGVAAYFGFKDPLWIRLIALISLVVFGFGFLLYILLLIIVPEASSSGDKLAMKGEPINVENIARTVEDEIDGIVTRGKSTIESTFSSKKKAIASPIFRFDAPFPKGFLF